MISITVSLSAEAFNNVSIAAGAIALPKSFGLVNPTSITLPIVNEVTLISLNKTSATIEVGDTLSTLANSFESKIDKHNITVINEVGNVHVENNYQMLKHIVSNIIENAIKYSKGISVISSVSIRSTNLSLPLNTTLLNRQAYRVIRKRIVDPLFPHSIAFVGAVNVLGGITSILSSAFLNVTPISSKADIVVIVS